MNKSKIINTIYYKLKPLIPRKFQIWLRRRLILRKRPLYEDIWPIDEKSNNPPMGWSGWPNGKKFALVLTHDIETVKGLRKCKELAKLEADLGFRSSFNFVAKGYPIKADIRRYLVENGFEVGLHGLYHDGNLFSSEKKFRERAFEINRYLKKWGAVGFRSPSMYHNLRMIGDLEIEYDASTFDTDPFEPQPDGVETIFPFWVGCNSGSRGYVELPYTLPQDYTVFVLMAEKDIVLWKNKLDWIVRCGGMALLIVHPDYINFGEGKAKMGEYPVRYYEDFLKYLKDRYGGQYWHVLPKEVAHFWAEHYRGGRGWFYTRMGGQP